MERSEFDRTIDYVELGVTSIDEAKRFYGAAFGWRFEDWGDAYASFADGRISGGFRKEDSVVRGGPLVVVYVLDLEAAVERVREAGGEIVRPTFAFPGGRRFHFRDPSGNELAAWSDH